ncbi:uncharacterized protein BP5553_00622 [Venustampulla echinocandica]|uniref:Uncharacterized protein n=1 Tax=Venustampulla echinocandica TaxID=2656787 RepID=A0A370TYP6_9HELO|nr:uncharacterized protein BP5553_00622 [Venustampulla echinocandica]RDL40643.1 hypothetical protein BP5553_00622 [Venustampulla echinocandica]
MSNLYGIMTRSSVLQVSSGASRIQVINASPTEGAQYAIPNAPKCPQLCDNKAAATKPDLLSSIAEVVQTPLPPKASETPKEFSNTVAS